MFDAVRVLGKQYDTDYDELRQFTFMACTILTKSSQVIN